ncbi:unnamed protein product [Oikopleura dioica]|uniref:Uncharacterized protein n=2 Tax=Oikopleura dioica TaxID=34765 RepID=E4YYZ9_OIKDI|nr:unnamed protein product [Oikopleura dioica]
MPIRYQNYAEEHEIFELVGNMMESLLLNRPADPLNYLISYLEGDNRRKVTVAVLGPPGAGKTCIAQQLAHITGVPIVSKLAQLQNNDPRYRYGYILDGVAESAEDVIVLQEAGCILDYVIYLHGPEELLRARQKDKWTDQTTGTVYHPVFNWPADELVANKLVKIPEKPFADEFASHQVKKDRVLQTYGHILHKINADQPLADVKKIASEIVSQRPMSKARVVTKALLLGPTGSGKRLVAERLHRNWGMVPIDLKLLIEQEKLNKTRIGQEILRNDGVVTKRALEFILKDRLEREDAVMNGWVIYSYPVECIYDLGEAMASTNIMPNRTVVFQLSENSIVERLANRMVDSLTGREYHALYNPATAENIRNRLVKREMDDSVSVKKRVNSFNNQLADILDVLNDTDPQMINADQDQNVVYQLVESKLAKPLPSKSFDGYAE